MMMVAPGLTAAAVLAVAHAVAGPAVPAPYVVPEPWRSLADCESDLTWDEGDGGLGTFRGGLQWTSRTWLAVKPAGAPDDPALASAEQEVAAAENLMDQPWGGYHHWPTCARKLGLIGAGR